LRHFELLVEVYLFCPGLYSRCFLSLRWFRFLPDRMKHVAVADVAFKIDYKFLDVRPKITRIHQPNIMLPYLADSILIKSENNVQTTVRDPAILVIRTYRFWYCDRRDVG
jgi:hypothetical protein